LVILAAVQGWYKKSFPDTSWPQQLTRHNQTRESRLKHELKQWMNQLTSRAADRLLFRWRLESRSSKARTRFVEETVTKLVPEGSCPVLTHRLRSNSGACLPGRPTEPSRNLVKSIVTKYSRLLSGMPKGGEEVKVIGGLCQCLGSVRRTIVRSSISVAESVDVTGPVHARV
jgi:hypothetical protein